MHRVCVTDMHHRWHLPLGCIQRRGERVSLASAMVACPFQQSLQSCRTHLPIHRALRPRLCPPTSCTMPCRPPLSKQLPRNCYGPCRWRLACPSGNVCSLQQPLASQGAKCAAAILHLYPVLLNPLNRPPGACAAAGCSIPRRIRHVATPSKWSARYRSGAPSLGLGAAKIDTYGTCCGSANLGSNE
jgi:hypothetical protein